MAIANRTEPSTVESKLRGRSSEVAPETPASHGSGQRVDDRVPAQYRQGTASGAGSEVALRLDRGEEVSGARLLLSDARVAFLLANEARHRAVDRLFGVPRDQANLVTLIALALALQAAREKTERLLRGLGPPSRADAALGGAAWRELLYDLGGPSSRDTPWFATLVTFALLAGLSGPTVRRSVRGIRASSHTLRAAFNHRYGHLVGGGKAHRHARSGLAQMTKSAAMTPHTNGAGDRRAGDGSRVTADASVGQPSTERSLA